MKDFYNNENDNSIENVLDYNELNISQEEKDVPLEPRFKSDDSLNPVQNRENLRIFDRIKGHKLLGCCVGILVLIFFVEEFKNSGKLSPVASSTIEIIKILIFSLTGFLFGKEHSEK